jgi:hypothetical protein
MQLGVPTTSATLHDPSTQRVTSSTVAVAHRQRARVAAGLTLCMGAILMVFNAAGGYGCVARWLYDLSDPISAVVLRSYDQAPHQRTLLFAVWCTAALVYAGVRGVLHVTHPRDVVDRRTAGWSWALPLAGASLLLPLTILGLGMDFVHRIVRAEDHLDRATFLPVLLVGHAHLVLAVLAGRAGWRMGTSIVTDETISTSSPWRALAWTTAAAAVPGIVMFAIPPVLTFIIGGTFVPLMDGLAEAGAVRERELLRTV